MAADHEIGDVRRQLAPPRNDIAAAFRTSRHEAATAFSISPTLFDEWVRLGLMPEGRKIGGVKLWDIEELWEAWCAIRDQMSGVKAEPNPFDGITV